MKRLLATTVAFFAFWQVEGISPAAQFVPLNFANNLFPSTPLKNMHTLAMRLWSSVEGAARHTSLCQWFEKHEALFAQDVLTLNTFVDMLRDSFNQQVSLSPESMSHVVEDCQHLITILEQAGHHYTKLACEVSVVHQTVVLYVLEVVIQKLTQFIQEHHAQSWRAAFFLRPYNLFPLLSDAGRFTSGLSDTALTYHHKLCAKYEAQRDLSGIARARSVTEGGAKTNYSRLTTPWLVPAKILPVAPIA